MLGDILLQAVLSYIYIFSNFLFSFVFPLYRSFGVQIIMLFVIFRSVLERRKLDVFKLVNISKFLHLSL